MTQIYIPTKYRVQLHCVQLGSADLVREFGELQTSKYP